MGVLYTLKAVFAEVEQGDCNRGKYQYSGSQVNSSFWCSLLLLLLSLLLEPFLSLPVLVPGEDPCHAHPGTRQVKLVAQLDQGVVFPQNLDHFHFHLWGGCLRKGRTLFAMQLNWKRFLFSNCVSLGQNWKLPVLHTCASGCGTEVPSGCCFLGVLEPVPSHPSRSHSWTLCSG